MRENAERVENRLVLLRDAIDSCYRRAADWVHIARIREAMWERAIRKGRYQVASLWLSLLREAQQAADLERAQLHSLELLQDQLELTAKCCWSDYHDLQHDPGSG
jgi:hypothetical protein